MVSGLNIAQDFFNRWGQPFLAQHYPYVASRVAAGRLMGSDVIGADDEISRDHCWGPQFHLWLSEGDYAAHGERIAAAMNAAAPNPWEGFRLAGAGDNSVEIHSIPAWFERRLGIRELPADAAAWRLLTKHESDLYFIRHGAVWIDQTGELTEWRRSLSTYPREVLKERIAEECFRVWHFGEYNFAQRMAKRRDAVSIAICKGEFICGVMRIVFLMRSDFTPYWKWLAFEFRKLPEATIYVPLLDRLAAPIDLDEQVRIIKTICAEVHKQLRTGGFVTGEAGNPYLLPLLNDHQELTARAEEASGRAEPAAG